MQRSVEHPGQNAHSERPISTWNGFVSLGLGIVLIAAGIWELIHGLAVERPAAAAAVAARLRGQMVGSGQSAQLQRRLALS